MEITYERMEGESTKAYEAFCEYRDMGRTRSQSKVSKKLGKSETLISRWSFTYDWVKRAAVWDDEQDAIAREANMKEILEMRKRHARIARKAIDAAEKALEKINDRRSTGSDIARLLSEASKMERLALGDAGEVVEERDGGQAISPVTFYIPDNHRGNTDQSEEDQEIEEEEENE